MIEAIKKRKSVRTYTDDMFDSRILSRLNTQLKKDYHGVFGNVISINMIKPAITKEDMVNMPIIASYGTIKGNMGYVFAACKKDEKAYVDYGYCLEKAVINMVDMGLGTCWIGGTFKRKELSDQFKLNDNEIIPAVIAFGIEAEKKRIAEKIMRSFSGSKNRKEWSKMFFNRSLDSPLKKEGAKEYVKMLECVRSAPSAVNNQPWRIIKEGRNFHFYQEASKEVAFNKVDMKKIDLGIAMAHFELAGKDLGLDVAWHVHEPKTYKGLEYIATANC